MRSSPVLIPMSVLEGLDLKREEGDSGAKNV